MPEVSPARSPLARWTTLGLGGPAGRVAVARAAGEIVQSVRSAGAEAPLILAGGSNVVIGDNGSAVVVAIHQKLGIPGAVYGMSVFTRSSRDTAPLGVALQPSSTPLGRLRNMFLYWLVERVIFR